MTLIRRSGMMSWPLLVLFYVLLLPILAAGAEPVATAPTTAREAALPDNPAYHVKNVSWEKEKDQFIVRIKGDTDPAYTKYLLFDPLRVVVDIANGKLEDTVRLPAQLSDGPVAAIKGRELSDKEPKVARLELLLATDTPYSVTSRDSDIIVAFDRVTEGRSTPLKKEKTRLAGQVTSRDDRAYGYEEAPDRKANEKDSGAGQDKPHANIFKGYTEKRISVDFYKIDLHNVFRLIGEVSGKNIVVDEQVTGSLTLALNDVPWDFALEIIVNLKDLQKEERHNTIVIAPKSKAYSWPQKESEIAMAVTPEDPYKVFAQAKETIKPTKGVMKSPTNAVQAKDFLDKAAEAEAAGDYPTAVEKYEKALTLIPGNASIASRLAGLHLVKLGHNSEGVHFARQALALNPKDYDSALMAAIGLANMKKDTEAQEYFDLALRAPRPTSEAISSYAAFIEEKGDFQTALLLLSRHETLYGDNLDTMIARARIYDKIGDAGKAAGEYKAALLSGFAMPDDLKRYIQGRIAMTGE